LTKAREVRETLLRQQPPSLSTLATKACSVAAFNKEAQRARRLASDGQYSIRTWYDWINDNPGISRLTFFRWLNDHGALPLRRFFPQRRCATLCQPVIVLSSSLHATIDQQISSNIDRYQQNSTDIRYQSFAHRLDMICDKV